MTISTTVTSSNIIKRADSLSDMNLLRSYPLREGKRIEVFFDSIKGAKTVIHENGKETELHFSDSGIPSELRFSFCKLKIYLEDTYASYNGGRVFINCRLRGGGHSKYSRTEFSRYVPPPPPKRIPVNYSAGHLITGLNRPEVQGGSFIEESGGVGHRNYSVVFQTHNASLKPSVTITVNKSEYNASEIRRLQSIRDQIFSNISDKARESSNLESRISTIQSLNQENIAQKQQKSQELTELESNREYENNLRFQEQELDRLKHRLQEVGGNIRSLISFIDLNNMHSLGIEIPAEVQSFEQKRLSIEPLVTTELLPNSLLSKCVISSSNWIGNREKAEGKDIVTFVGNTGTGKSTAVNYLLGIPIIYSKEEGCLKVKEGYTEAAKIGHAGSETLYTQIHQNSDFVFADCGGFLDTRSLEEEFQAMASLKLTISSSSTVKLILCFDARMADIKSNRGVKFNEFLNMSLGQLIEDYRSSSKSVLLMLTKPPRFEDENDDESPLYTRESALKKIYELKQILPEDSPLQAFYDYLLRENGRYICVCNPLNEDGIIEIQSLVREMVGISSLNAKVPMSDSLRRVLLEEMTSIAHQANELYEAFQRASKEVSRLKPLVLDIEKKKLALKKELEQLEKTIQNQASELSQVQSLRGRVLGELRQLEQQKSQKDGEISNLSSGAVRYNSDGGSWQIS